jgi:nitrite reductase/ring-hydroxylating ferredoxin subunit
MGQYFKAAKAADVASGKLRAVEINGKRIALFSIGGQIYAIGDLCTHQGGPLSDGAIENNEVECPWHGGRFNVTSGQATVPPAGEAVERYNVRISGEDVEIEV